MALVVATFAVYSPVARNEFVTFDDPDYIVDNPGVNEGLSWDGVAWACTAFHSSNWHPLTWMSHQLDVTLFGLDAGRHHLMSVGLHALGAALAFAALFLATRQLWASAWVAAIFALHPLRVESVAWASERKDVLAGLFFWLTLLLYVRYARRPSRSAYLAALGAFALGLLSKPMLVTVPFVLLLLDRWPLERWNTVGAKRLVMEKLPFFLLVAASTLVTLSAQNAGRAVQSLARIPSEARISNALSAYGTYLWKTVWPTDLAFFHPHPLLSRLDWRPWETSASIGLVLLAAVSLLAWRRRDRFPAELVGWFWFVGMLFPVIGLVQVGEQAWAERYAYLPLVGITLVVAAQGAAQVRRTAALKLPLAALALATVLACGFLSWKQVRTWRDSGTLYRHALRVTEGNFRAWLGLGNLFQRDGDPETAVHSYSQALEIRPDYAPALFNRGLVHQTTGNTQAAIADFERAIASDPLYVPPYLNLSEVLARTGRIDVAGEVLVRLLARYPDEPNAHYNLGLVRIEEEDDEAALEHLRRAARQTPEEPQIRHALGKVCARAGLRAEAIEHLRAACELAPERSPAAAQLAWILATAPEEDLRDEEEALRWAGYALDVRAAGSLEVLEALAAALANAGRYDEACDWQTKAVERAPLDRRGLLRRRLHLYEQGKPFRESPLP